MGEEKVRPILSVVIESRDKGWKTWSAQTTELQLLRTTMTTGRSRVGQGFLKMDEAAITGVQEEIARDLYELSTSHREEIVKLMENYDGHHMATAL